MVHSASPLPILPWALLLSAALSGCAASGLPEDDIEAEAGGTTNTPADPASVDSGGDAGSGSGGAAGSGSAAGRSLGDCSTEQPSGPAEGWIAFDSDREDFNRDIYLVRPNGAELRRLTNDPAIDKEPSLSPDGKRLAFTSDRDGKSQVYVLDIATAEVTRVTQRPEGADQPSYSHDGKLLAFHSGASVYTIATNGTNERLVATGLDNFNAYFWPHFSLDDTELVFDRNNEINALQIKSGAMRQIVQNWTTTIKSPSVSLNGTDVAYHVNCDGSGTSVWTTPFSTTTDPCAGRRVTPVGDTDTARPAWGPNNRIAYERIDRQTNVATIALISRQGGSAPCELTPGDADNRNPSWWPGTSRQ